jgi:MSHA pilin protein MshD
MCTTRSQRGFTLIELIIFIVVVSIALAGILSVMNTVVKSSADPLVRKQSIALADSLLEEILLKNFNDPDGTEVGETDRSNWDDVGDYNGKTASAFVLPSELAGYQIAIAVVSDTATVGTPAKPAKRVTVTVSRGGESISMTGYRTCYMEVVPCP